MNNLNGKIIMIDPFHNGSKYYKMDKHEITFSFDQSKVKQEFPSHKIDHSQLSESFDGTTFRIGHFVRCQIINNKLDPLKLHNLLRLMHIFADSLPSMKINQLYNYVFSISCEKLLIFYKDRLIGGLCFNSFPKQYVQIDLLSISKQYQRLGMGTILLNTLKRLLQIRKTHLIVTNADNNSIQFYRRNNFSQTQFISNRVWSKKNQIFGFSTKMQCIVYPNINYFKFKHALGSQKEYLVTLMKQTLFSQKEYKAVVPNPYKQVFETSNDNNQEYFLINPLELDGVRDNGWNWSEYKHQKQMKETQNYRLFGKTFNEIYQLSEPQLKKIDKIIIQSNFILYSQPMDLDSIRKQIQKNKFQNQDIFWYEICHFIENAKRLYRLNERLINNLNVLEQKVPPERRSTFRGQFKI